MNPEIKSISEAYIGMLSEEIKGWKHAGADLAKIRKNASNESKSVSLVKLKKDGSESKMHDALSKHNSEDDARQYHKRIRDLNPKSDIKHNLYVDGKLKEALQ